MINLYDSESNRLLGAVSDGDLQALVDALEEESSDDRDYYVNADTIDLLAATGSPQLIDLLRGALGSSEGIEVRWERAAS
jgi:HEAT repeat protein